VEGHSATCLMSCGGRTSGSKCHIQAAKVLFFLGLKLGVQQDQLCCRHPQRPQCWDAHASGERLGSLPHAPPVAQALRAQESSAPIPVFFKRCLVFFSAQGGQLFFPDAWMLMQAMMCGVPLPDSACPCLVPGSAGLALPRTTTAVCRESGRCWAVEGLRYFPT